jgi:hypothetical protein
MEGNESVMCSFAKHGLSWSYYFLLTDVLVCKMKCLELCFLLKLSIL